MSDKIKEIDFEELWNKVREMREKAVLADEACRLLSKLYDDDVEFTVEDDHGRTYDGDVDSVIYKCDLKDFAHDKAIETRDKCVLDILKTCREIGEYNGVDFEHYTPGGLERFEEGNLMTENEKKMVYRQVLKAMRSLVPIGKMTTDEEVLNFVERTIKESINLILNKTNKLNDVGLIRFQVMRLRNSTDMTNEEIANEVGVAEAYVKVICEYMKY